MTMASCNVKERCRKAKLVYKHTPIQQVKGEGGDLQAHHQNKGDVCSSWVWACVWMGVESTYHPACRSSMYVRGRRNGHCEYLPWFPSSLPG